jgi:hypothetical protein
MRPVLVIVTSGIVVLAACAAPAIDDTLETDGVKLPQRASTSGSDGGASSGNNGSSGTPSPQSANVTLTVAVTGTGTVTSTPSGVTCAGATCTGSFPKGTSVTLSAAPGAGAVFGGWSGACTGTAACTTSLANDTTVNADFPTLGGSWSGNYTNARMAAGCTFTNAGKLDVTFKASGTTISSSSESITGLELRSIPSCQLVGSTTGSAPDAPVTLAGNTITGTWTFDVKNASGTLAFPFTAKLAGKTITGTWTCSTCTGSFTLTKP